MKTTLIKFADLDQTRQLNIMRDAERYAAADKSDPFAIARIKAHLKSGIASVAVTGKEVREDFYTADENHSNRARP